ncbi:O-acetylhomoserine (thiol)-lyase [Sporocytophaga myxococcoides]|uniref:O-acetylhomoserine (Thiol)-lyase n=1 Tax=Sporocytophaga myxococcoides TaxID=153721 RepID=A0A098LFR7_9BACT|nr:PLP-dependent transferase [Sporocytophaga myxococcoides]GAL85309.1 O-acetylhomoserine (thiol)-lyase [Sporocytophaga myxococcoides]
MKNSFNNPYILSENNSDLFEEYLNPSEKAEEYGQDYSTTNPKVTFFEQRIAALEGGTNALVVKSLHAAKFLLFKTLLTAGQNIVTVNPSTFQGKEKSKLQVMGIAVKTVSKYSLPAFKSLIDNKTGIIFLETIGENDLSIPDFARIIAVAKEKNVPVVVDNSHGVAGYFIKPLSKGASIVIESTGEYFDNASNTPQAVIIEGNTDWSKFNIKTSPEEISYLTLDNGLIRLENISASSKVTLIDLLRKSASNYNKYEIPNDPLSLIHKLETIYSKASQRSENALQIAKYLNSNDHIAKVVYAGLPNSESYLPAFINMRNGFGNRIGFYLKDRTQTGAFVKSINEKTPGIKLKIVLNENGPLIIFSASEDAISTVVALENALNNLKRPIVEAQALQLTSNLNEII